MDLESGQPESSERKRRLRRGWIEVIIAVAMVLAAPVIVSLQSGEAHEPWDEIWIGGWPPMLEQDQAAADPNTAHLRQRAAAALERVMQPEQPVHERLVALD
jgi:hypothetical protein